MAVSPTAGCIYFTACYNNVNYVKYPAQNGNPAEAYDISVSPAVQVTDQAIIDAIQPAGCSSGIEITDCAVNVDGSISLTLDTPDGVKPVTIPVEYVDDDVRLSKGVAGDVSPFAFTLADGVTVVNAGDPVPAGVCITFLVDDNGNYVPGDDDFYESSDENHTTVVLLPGDTVADTLVDENGDTVYTAGDIVPENICVFYELDTDGNVIPTSIQVHDKGGSATFTYIENPGDLVDGTPVTPLPDGSIPIIFSNPKALFQEPAIDKCNVTEVLVTDGTECGPAPLTDLNRNHIFSRCVTTAEVITELGAAEPVTLSMVEQDTGQLGTMVLAFGSTNAIPTASVQPYTVTLPPSTPGCVQFVELSYGAQDGSGGGEQLNGTHGTPRPALAPATGNQTGDISNETLVMNTAYNYQASGNNPAVTQNVYAYEVTGTAGGSVDFTFPQANPNPADGAYNGVLHHTVWEVCPSTGALTIAQFGAANIVEAEVVTDPVPLGTAIDSGPVDGGSCDAIYFGSGRHVAHGANPSDVANGVSDWSTPSDPAVQEVTDLASMTTLDRCQLGVTGGLIPAGTGPVTFSWTHNDPNDFSTGGQNPWAAWGVLPFTGCADGQSGPVRTTKCEQQLLNDCHGSAKLSVQASASAELTLEAGANICINPVVNGLVLTTEVVGYDNTNGSDTVITLPISFTWCDPVNLVAPDGVIDVDVCYEITDKNGVSDNSQISITDVIVDAELVHV